MTIQLKVLKAKIPLRTLGLVVGGTILLIFPLLGPGTYVLHITILLLLSIALGESWNIVGGYAGQLSLGHAIFFGIGAYTTTILLTQVSLTAWVGMLLGVVLAVVVASAIGYVCFRLRGPYFALATLAVAEIFRIIALNWRSLTNGGEGMIILSSHKIEIPLLTTIEFIGKVPFYYSMLFLAAACIFISYKIANSKFGFYLIAIREEQDAAEAIGIDTTRYKVLSLLVSAGFTSIGGSLYALYTGYIDPFTVLHTGLSIEMVLIAIIGGMGTVAGPVVGAFIVVPLSEFLRATFVSGHLFIYGVLVIMVILFMPDGILGGLRSLHQPPVKSIREDL